MATPSIQELTQQIEKLTKDNQELTGKIEAADQKATDLQTKLTAAEGQVTELTGKLEAADQKAGDLQTKLTAAEGQVTELKGKLTAETTKLTEAETARDQAKVDAQKTREAAARFGVKLPAQVDGAQSGAEGKKADVTNLTGLEKAKAAHSAEAAGKAEYARL